jgi:hypothetical protein
MNDALYQYVIYDHPSDYPDELVCRRIAITAGAMIWDKEPFWTGQNIEEIRLILMGRGLVCLMRDPDDDPVIVETWM